MDGNGLKRGDLSQCHMALDGLRSGIFAALAKLKGRAKLNEAELADMIRSLRRALQEADFNVRQTKEITERVEEKMRTDERRPGLTIQTQALNILYTELVRLSARQRRFDPMPKRYCWSVYMVRVKPPPQPKWPNGTAAATTSKLR